MLKEIIRDLTNEQKSVLYISGISPATISTWNTGKRRPTYAQCVIIADATGYSLEKLLVEMALKDSTPELRKKFYHLLEK